MAAPNNYQTKPTRTNEAMAAPSNYQNTNAAPTGLGAERTVGNAGVDTRSTGQKLKDVVNPDKNSTAGTYNTTGAGVHNTGATTTAAPGTSSTTGAGGHPRGAVHTGANSGVRGNANVGTGESTGQKIGGGVGAVFAGIHGAGERLRGEINQGVDEVFGEREGVAKNKAVANAGDQEMATGHFAPETKDREGAGTAGRRL